MPYSSKKWWQRAFSAWKRTPANRKRPTWRRSSPLQLEALEDRLVPSTWTVETAAATGVGSLAAALTSANGDSSPAIINFDPAVFTTATTITLASTLTLSNTSQSITINGSGAGPITISGGGTVGDFAINTGVTAAIDNLKITGGSSSSTGSGIDNSGTLTLEQCTISNNTSPGEGALMNEGGMMTVINSLISANSSGYTGGGITNSFSGTATVVNTTIVGNSAQLGAGFYQDRGAMATITNSTIADNSAQTGGGIANSYYAAATQLVLENTIVAGNTAATGPDVSNNTGGIISASYSLIGNAAGSGISGGTGNILNVPSPGLGALGNNGGPTQTIPLSTTDGTGYAVNDVLTVNLPSGTSGFGTVTTDPTVKVLTVSGGGVASFSVVNPGAFSQLPTSTLIVATTDQTTASANGCLLSIAPANCAGTGPYALAAPYKLYDTLQVVGGTVASGGSPTTLLVTKINANGTVAAVAVMNPGNYSVLPSGTVATTPWTAGGAQGTNGTGCTVTVTPALAVTTASGAVSTAGAIASLTLNSGGSGYGATAPTVFFSGGGGSGATATATLTGGVVTGLTLTNGGTGYTSAPTVGFAGGAVTNAAPVTTAGVGDGAGITVTVGTIGTGGTVSTISANTIGLQANYPASSNTIVMVLGPTPNADYSNMCFLQPNPAPGGGTHNVTANQGWTVLQAGSGYVAGTTYPTILCPGDNTANTFAATLAGAAAVSAGTDIDVTTTTACTWTAGSTTLTQTLANAAGTLTAATTSATITGAGTQFTHQFAAGYQLFTTGNVYVGTVAYVSSDTSLTLTADAAAAVTASAFQVNPIVVGQVVTGAGIPNNTTVTSVASQGLTFTISSPTTAAGTNANVTVLPGVVAVAAGGRALVLSGTYTDAAESSTAASITLQILPTAASATATPTVSTGSYTGTSGAPLTVPLGAGAYPTIAGCNFAGGVTSITVPSTSGLAVGQTVADSTTLANIPAGTTITALVTNTANGTSTLTLSNATAGASAASGDTLTIATAAIITPTWDGTTFSSVVVSAGGYYAMAPTSPFIYDGGSFTLTTGTGTGITAAAVAGNATPPTLASNPALGAAGSLTTASSAIATGDATVTVANGYVFASSSLPLLSQFQFTTQPNETAPGVFLNPVTVQGLNTGAYFYIQVGTEEMAVNGLTLNANGTATLNVLRGANGTTAAPHAVNALVYLVSDQRGEVAKANTPVLDMGAYQSTAAAPAALASADAGATVTITLSSGSLSGTTTAVTNAAGVATFSTLSVGAPGTYQLTATSGSATATSSQFVISTSTLSFGTQPASVYTGSSLGSVTVNDKIGSTPVAGATLTMTISTGGTLNGTLTATTNAAGLATFANLTVSTAGTYTLTASASGALSATSSSFTITALPAGSLIVTTNSDAATHTGTSLRDAINIANTDAGNGISDTITFASNLNGQTITLTQGTLTLSGIGATIIIDGGNQVTVSGNNTNTVFQENTSVNAIFNGLTIIKGTAASNGGGLDSMGTASVINCTFTADSVPNGAGGGVANTGVMTVSNCVLSGNTASIYTSYYGGGFYNAGTMTVSNTTISGNTGFCSGFWNDAMLTITNCTISGNTNSPGCGAGGFYNDSNGSLTMSDCTISANAVSGEYGGGFFNAGPMTLTNSIVSGNTGDTGGGIYASSGPLTMIDDLVTANVGTNSDGGGIDLEGGSVTMVDCTVVGNSAGTGGGIYNSYSYNLHLTNCTVSGNTGGGIYGTVSGMVNTIVAGNNGGDVSGTAAGNNNIVGNGSGITGITNGTTGNQVGTSANPLNPNLGALASNGGFTQTMALGTGSKAIATGGSITKANAALTTGSSTVTVANGLAFADNNLPALSQLAFTSQPNNVAAGSPLNAVSVQELDSGAYFYIQIDGEEMAVTSLILNSDNTAMLSVLRGVNGTTIAPHAVNAPIDLVSDQRGEVTSFNNPAVVDIGAYQSTASSPAPLNSNPVVGDTITMSLSAGSLTGTNTATTNATGIATFTNLSVANAGTYTLTASSASESTVSNSFVVTAGALTFTSQPVSTIVGGSLGVITVTDFKVGNPVAGAIIDMTISYGVLSGTTTATTNAAGTATFTTLSVNAAGTYTLSASAAGAATAYSSSFTISALALVFSTSPPNTGAGSPFTVGLSYSSAGAPVAGAVITLSVSSGTFTGPSTATTSALGIATFSGLSITTPGTYTLLATSPGPSANSSAFIISAGAVASLSFTTQPVSTTAGSTLNAVVVKAADAYGNLISGLAVKLGVSSGTLNGTLMATTNASGLATFSGLSDNAAGTYTLTATAGTATGVSSSFTLTTAGLASLAFTTEPVSITAGNAVGTVVVKAVDPFGNILPGTVVSLSISSGTLNGTLTATASASGLATFAGLTDTTAGTYTLTATSGTVTALSSQFIIAPAAASKLKFTTEPPASITANASFAAAVQVTDAYGNPVSNTAVTLASSWSTLTGATTAVSDATGTATFGGLAMSTVGTGTLNATAGTLTAQSTSISVTPSGLAALAFTIQPASTTAGSTLGSVTVKATDSFGNAIANALINLSISSSSLNGTTSTAAGSTGLALFNNLSIDLAGAYTITATSGTVTVKSQSFIISPATASTLAWTSAPVSTTAGLTFATVAVKVTDTFGNPVPNVTVKVTPAASTLGGTTSVASDAAGTASFATLSMTKAGSYTLTATATGMASIVSGSFTIAPAAPAQLLFTTQPKNVAAGAALNVAVEVLDSFANPVPGVAIGSLTLSPAVTLKNFATTATTTTGLAAFNGLSVNTSGTYTMTASGAGLNATSTPFVISPASVAAISFVNQPGTTNAGNVIGPVTAQAVDAFGNPVPNVAVGMALTGGSFSAGTTTIMTNTQGQAVFGNLVAKSAGSYTLAMSATGVASASSNSFSVIVAAPMLSFAIQPVNANNGISMRTVTVRAADKYGNVVPGLVVHLTLSSGALTGPTTATTNATGQASFSTLSIMPPGTGYTLMASATGLPSVRSNAFNIVALRGSSLVFTTQPADTTAGSNLGPVTLQSLDVNNNPVCGIPVTISLLSSGKLAGSLSAVTDTSGNAVFSNLSENLVGTFALRATSQGMTITSSPFTITAGSVGKVTFVTQPIAAVAGSAIKAVAVLATDKFGNIVAGATVNIALSSGVLADGTLTAVTDASGRGVFSDLVEDTAGTYTLSATAGSASATSRSLVVKPAAASQLTFLSQPGNGKAGTSLGSFTLEALDSFGNVATTSHTAIRISDGTLSKGPYLTNALGQAIITGWTDTVAGTFTLTASASGVPSAQSNGYAIAPAAGALSFVGVLRNVVAGNDFGPVTVRVADRYGNGLSGVAVAIGILPGALSSGGQTLTTGSTGEVVFDPLTENLVGTYALLATATGVGSLRSKTFTITAAAPATLTFTTQPFNATAGGKLGAVTAQFLDPYGNAVTTAGTQVTMTVSAGTLNGTLTAGTNALGRAIFNSLSETMAGTYSLLAAGAGLDATSQSFVVSAGAASRLTFLVQPAGTTVGGNLGTVTVQADDSFGNPVMGQTLTITGSMSTLTGVKSAVTDATGDVIFSDLSVTKSGTFTLSAFDGCKTAKSNPFTITAIS